MSFSSATVVDTLALSPRVRRVVLQIDDPEALAVKSGGDSAVGVYFSAPQGEGRNYSVRYHEGDRITLDVVLHARGLATTWARGARPGDRVGLDHARSWYRPEPSTHWQLLVADLSGLPATARIIEELPEGVPATAIVEVADQDDLDYLPRRESVTVIACVGTGNGMAPSRLAAAVRDFTVPAGRGYCWFAGEAAESRAVRKYLRGMGWAIDQMDVTGYWRFDSETWDAKYALVAEEVEAVWVDAMREGRGERAADEAFDEALERAGL
ncbi:siderophore-interacting protein [Mycolicibacterium stellerae]|uniref:siderophore-interacting protein n=1 Tax=Mycolicibacterium stellerae TaxID=2358193 RepID=UPI000F0B30D6|nr:siderophore-interacting protein [Mycolicibacterium stellerae]